MKAAGTGELENHKAYAVTPLVSSAAFITPLQNIQEQLEQFISASDSKLQVLDVAENDVGSAITIATNPFPTLSDVRRLKSLPNDAADSIWEVLSDEEIKVKPSVRAKLLIIVVKLRSLSASITRETKNGGDCRAPMVILR